MADQNMVVFCDRLKRQNFVWYEKEKKYAVINEVVEHHQTAA